VTATTTDARTSPIVEGRSPQLPLPSGVTSSTSGTLTPGRGEVPAPRTKAITIGAVCKALAQEFSDISISKIRYLEDQKLLTPRRTPGGYRLYTPHDVARLRTILRMQRDEFLPLRVIRQELAVGRPEDAVSSATSAPAAPRREGTRQWRPSVAQEPGGALYTLEDVLEETRAAPQLVRELEEFNIVSAVVRGGLRYYDETDREIVRAAAELARYGVGGRNLRVFRSSADREAGLIQQLLGPALRSRNADRRKEALEALESLAAVASHLGHLLLIRDLRKIAG
jgi:DNA-binding transcriptional MerR regulator